MNGYFWTNEPFNGWWKNCCRNIFEKLIVEKNMWRSWSKMGNTRKFNITERCVVCGLIFNSYSCQFCLLKDSLEREVTLGAVKRIVLALRRGTMRKKSMKIATNIGSIIGQEANDYNKQKWKDQWRKTCRIYTMFGIFLEKNFLIPELQYLKWRGNKYKVKQI